MTVKIMVNKLTYYEYKVPVQKSQMGYSRKKSKQGGGIAYQVPDNYQPLATNKLLLALFSLFTNAITQLAAAIAIPSSGATSDNFSRFSLIS